MSFSPNAASVYADGPVANPLQPSKPEIRAYLLQLEAATDAIASGAGTIAKQTLAQLNADLAHNADTMAWVYADGNIASNGIYCKNGAAGAGSWSFALPLPYTFIVAGNSGAGTPNAIKATSSVPVTNGMLVSVPITVANTNSPVTIAFNSQAPLTIKTRSGQDVAQGDLTPGYILGARLGSLFYLLSDTAVASLIYAARDAAFTARDAAQEAQASAEAARDIAAGYASDAVSQGNVPIYGTVDGLVALPGTSPGIPVGINAIRVNGKSTVGDGKGGFYIDSNNGSADNFVSGGATSRTWYRAYDEILLVGMSTVTPYGFETRRFTNIGFEVIYSTITTRDFGHAAIHAKVEGNRHGIVGEVVQNNAPGNWSFPCGVTGYGKLDSPGNQVFGFFGRVDQYTAGVSTHELNTFNYFNGPPGIFPPDRGFGITNAIPVTLTLAAGGTYQSLIACQIGKEGSEPNSYVCGIYMNYGAVTNFGIIVDAIDFVQTPEISAFFKNGFKSAASAALNLQSVNNLPVPGARLLRCMDIGGNEIFGVLPDGKRVFNVGNKKTTVGAAGAAAVLPSNPTMYEIVFCTDGVYRQTPLYELGA